MIKIKLKIHCGPLYKKDLFNIILITGLLKPVGIERLSSTLNLVLNIVRLFAMTYITLHFLLNIKKKRVRPDDFILLIAGILILSVAISLLVGSSCYNVFVYWYGILCMILWGRANEKRNGDLTWVIKIFRIALQIYVFLNFLFVITLCDLSKRPNARIYILGNKNMVVLFVIPYLLIQTVYAKFNNEKYSLKNIVCITIAIITILITRSSTGIIACLLFVLMSYVPLIDRWMKWVNARICIIITVSTFLASVVFQIQKYFSTFIINILGKDMTLTGRSYIWERTMRLICKHPFGYGWDAVVDRIPAFLSFTTETTVGHAHNFFLNLAFKSGIQTAVLYLILLYQVARRLDRSYSARGYLAKNRPLVEFKAFWVIFLMLTLVEAYPTNCIALFFCLYLIYKISKINRYMGDHNEGLDRWK